MKSILKLTFILVAGLLGSAVISACDDDNFDDVVPDFATAIIRTFEVDGKLATINQTTATITLTLPSGSDVSAVTPLITLPENTSVEPAPGSTIDFSGGPVIYTTAAANGANREYTVSVGAFGDPRILSFSIEGNVGVIDDEAGTIFVEIGSDDGDITSLAPNFIIAEGTSVDKPSGVSQNFTNPVVYTILSNDGFTAREYTVTVNQVAAPEIVSFTVDETDGIIDNDANTIFVQVPAGTDLTAVSPVITVPEGQLLEPGSGVPQDFTDPVAYTVTNTEGLSKTYNATLEVLEADPTLYAFFGEGADISSLIDDDAKAAASWMESTYGADFVYVPFSEITPQVLADIKVGMIYYLTPLQDVGFSATPTDVSTLLPVELKGSAAQLQSLKSWVKNGGDLLLAGEATPLIFELDRVPADFSAPRGPGNYVYSEFGCAESTGCVDVGKPADDRWGLGMRPTNNSEDRRGHPIFNNLTFFNDEFLALQNSATREVRLIWWQHFDGILDPSCCGQDAALFFEQTFNAIKFGTLSFVGDAFGYGAVMWNRTDLTNDPNFENQIGTDYKGYIFTIENTIVGYEWDSNGTTNDFQGNIEVFTGNILDYMYNLD